MVSSKREDSKSDEKQRLLPDRDRAGDDTHLLEKSSESPLKSRCKKQERNQSSSTGLGSYFLQEEKLRKWNIFFPKHYHLQTNLFFGVCYLLVVLYSILIFVGPLILHFGDKDVWCDLSDEERMLQEQRMLHSSSNKDADSDNPYDNPDYITDPCRYKRWPNILYLTLEECDISRRLLTAVLLGGAIGYERRAADRPAGIRTMGLVSLGACFFTTSSIMAFKSSTMDWDASRVAAALPSGVGFLGGALIWKGSVFVEDQEMHQVHGLTTAASLWLSAAVGVGVGGALYLVTIYVTILVIMILRYGPILYSDREEEEEEEEKEMDYDEEDEKGGEEDNISLVTPARSLAKQDPLVRARSGVSMVHEDFPSQQQTYPLTSRQSIAHPRVRRSSIRKSLKAVPTFND